MADSREPEPGEIDDWESPDFPPEPFKLVPAYVADRLFYRVVAWALALVAGAAFRSARARVAHCFPS